MIVAVLAFLVQPARDALHNDIPLVVLGLAVLLIAEQELLRAGRDGPRAALMPRAPIAALSLAVGIVFILRLRELAG